MKTTLLDEFERALRERNPTLANRLQPGLPETRIRRMLSRAKVQGAVEPVIELFSWRNGSQLDPSVAQFSSPFPKSDYIFMDFELMLADFDGFKEGAIYHPRMTELVGRYFPIFWDGSNGWLAVDIGSLSPNRVVLVDAQCEEPVKDAYRSFHEFLKDAIRANEENDKLACFK